MTTIAQRAASDSDCDFLFGPLGQPSFIKAPCDGAIPWPGANKHPNDIRENEAAIVRRELAALNGA